MSCLSVKLFCTECYGTPRWTKVTYKIDFQSTSEIDFQSTSEIDFQSTSEIDF